MKLHCPHCGVKGSAEDSYIRRKVKCPKCQGVFEVLSDLASEPPADAAFPATLSPLPAEIPSSVPGVEIPVSADDDLFETEIEKQSTTVADAAFVEAELEAHYEPSEEVTEPEPVLASAAEQGETLDWDDIASEIDLQLAEATMGEEQEGYLQDGPAALSSFEEDFEKPVDDFDRMEALPALGAAHAEGPAEQKNDDQGETAVAESSEEDMPGKGVELEPYGVDKEQCWECGKEGGVGESFVAMDGRLYCLDCAPVKEVWMAAETARGQIKEQTLFAEEKNVGEMGLMDDAGSGFTGAFSMGEVIREAWGKTKGAKGAIWAASAVMYGVILVIGAGGALLLPPLDNGLANPTGLAGNLLFQSVTNVLSVLFTAGLLFMGMRQAAGKSISWKMIARGFSCAAPIIVATILQFILVTLGFLLLVLPGIYLVVGYALTIPLIIDKGLSPWQAMELSRKVIHKIWWKMAGLLVAVGLILAASLLALGIGLIWTWPMFIILAGVVYRHLFGELEKAG
jgi:phage FluMu protein Com